MQLLCCAVDPEIAHDRPEHLLVSGYPATVAVVAVVGGGGKTLPRTRYAHTLLRLRQPQALTALAQLTLTNALCTRSGRRRSDRTYTSNYYWSGDAYSSELLYTKSKQPHRRAHKMSRTSAPSISNCCRTTEGRSSPTDIPSTSGAPSPISRRLWHNTDKLPAVSSQYSTNP